MLLSRQCSECDNSNSNSEPETVDPNAPRKLRYGAGERSISDSRRSSSVANDVCILKKKKVLDIYTN
jgi:hypothetical protein